MCGKRSEGVSNRQLTHVRRCPFCGGSVTADLRLSKAQIEEIKKLRKGY
jgi:hypothetical protein